MYKRKLPSKTTISVNKSYAGERIEQKIQRILSNKEPISDGAPLIYTERKLGVQPAYDPRTDRFEIAVEAMDKVAKTKVAQREARINPKTEETPKNDGKPEPIQGT